MTETPGAPGRKKTSGRAQPHKHSAATLTSSRPPRVVVVDDDLDILNIVELLLIEDGFRVASATHTEEATRMLDLEATDLLITDLRLGDGDGIEVIRHASRLTPRRPRVILLTARQTQPDGDEAKLLAELDGIMVQKPFDIDQMIEVVRSLTGWRGRS